MKLPDIQKLVEAATPGPWVQKMLVSHNKATAGEVYWALKIGDTFLDDIDDIGDNDLRFIAASRTMMPKLLAVAEAARQAVNSGIWLTVAGGNSFLPELEGNMRDALSEALAKLEEDV